MNMQSTSKALVGIGITLLVVSLTGCGIQVQTPDAQPDDVSFEQLEGVQLVQAAKLVRGSCAAICDAYAECGIPHATCHEICRGQEEDFLKSRSLACAEAMTESYRCLEAALCPADEASFQHDIMLCELAHDDQLRSACSPAPIDPSTTASMPIDPAAKDVCTDYCDRMSDCGITSPSEARGACLTDCIDSVSAMSDISQNDCGDPVVSALSCAASLQCGDLKAASVSIWVAGAEGLGGKCTDELPQVARCTLAVANDTPVAAAPQVVDVKNAVPVQSVASCHSLCALDTACELGLDSGRDSCVSECISLLDSTQGGSSASTACIDARVDLQFCLGRLTCGEFSDYMTAQVKPGMEYECEAEANALADRCTEL